MNSSKRSQKLISSPIRKFLPLVQAAEAKGIKIYKLNVGDPDLPMPGSFLAAIRNYKKNHLGYAPSPGLKEHTTAWVKYYRTVGVKLETKNIIPTVGGAEAILLAILATTDPGDEVIVFEPLYTSYKGFAVMAGVKLVPITLLAKNNFSLPSAKEIEKKITPKTRAIVVITPNNPTGSTLSDQEFKTLIQIAEKHQLFIVSDETYREIVFSGKPNSLLKYPSAKDLGIVVDSTSKRFSCPGARIGCLASYNEEIMQSVLKLAMIRLSAPTLEQIGLIPVLNNPKPYIKKIVAEYKRRRDFVCQALKKIPGVTYSQPNGAFYLIAQLPVKNSEEFIKWLLTSFSNRNETLLLTPTAEFYITPNQGKNEVRIAYVLNRSDLKKAINILAQALKEYND